jgi:hypothetical protein
LLAFYIILIVAHAIVFCIVIWDFCVFVSFVYKRKKRFTIGIVCIGSVPPCPARPAQLFMSQVPPFSSKS